MKKFLVVVFSIILCITSFTNYAKAETVADLVTDIIEINNFYTVELAESQSIYYEVTLPTKGTIKFNFSCNDGYGDKFTREFTIYDEAGNILYEDSVFYNEDDVVRATLPAGTYHVQFKNGGNGTSNPVKLAKFYVAFEKANINTFTLSVTIKKGEAVQLGTEFSEANNAKIKWKSSKYNIATVSNKGLVKAVKVGKTTITAIASTGENLKVIVKVIK